VWTGFFSVEVLPSPKSQDQEVATGMEVSLNATANGTVPPVTLAVKFATGAAGGSWLKIRTWLTHLGEAPAAEG
jgi:hypothetical protein